MRRDFSLIELLIVIGIIAMVSVVALKQFSGSYGPGDRVLVKNLVLKSFAEARLKAKMSGQVVSLKFEKSNDEKIIRVAHISDLEKVDSELELNSEEESFQLPDTSSWSDDAQEAFIFIQMVRPRGQSLLCNVINQNFLFRWIVLIVS